MHASATAVTVLAGVFAVSGCAGGHRTGLPATSGPRPAPAARGSSRSARPLNIPVSPKLAAELNNLGAARLLSPTRLAFPSIGSSNCPSAPVKLIVRTPHAIRINLVVGRWGQTRSGQRVRVPHSPGTCLEDLHISPAIVAIDPKQVDVHHTVKVSLYYPKGVIRRYHRPIVLVAPPLASPRVQEEARIARSSKELFSIFPAAPGQQPCLMPTHSRTKPLVSGMCETSVHPDRETHEPAVIVSFTERWGRVAYCPGKGYCFVPYRWHHTWQVIEGEPIDEPGAMPRVLATRSSGTAAPQDHK